MRWMTDINEWTEWDKMIKLNERIRWISDMNELDEFIRWIN